MIIKQILSKKKRSILTYIERNKFVRANNGIRLLPSVELRNAKFIRCSNDAAIGENSKLLCVAKYNGVEFEPKIEIGKNFHATRKLVIQCAYKVIIGDNVLVASNVFIIDYNHGLSPETESYLDNSLELSDGVFIEDGVWIGNSAIILPGVRIGKKSIIGAGSVVSSDIPSYSLAVGVPAKVIKRYDFKSKSWKKV